MAEREIALSFSAGAALGSAVCYGLLYRFSLRAIFGPRNRFQSRWPRDLIGSFLQKYLGNHRLVAKLLFQ